MMYSTRQETSSHIYFGDPWVVKQHHRNTGAKENHQLNSVEPRNRHKNFGPDHLMHNSLVGVITDISLMLSKLGLPTDALYAV